VQVPPGGRWALRSPLERRTSRALEAHTEIGDVEVDLNEDWCGVRPGRRKRESGASTGCLVAWVMKLVTWVMAEARELRGEAMRLCQVIL
jgi:hypothetical protein